MSQDTSKGAVPQAKKKQHVQRPTAPQSKGAIAARIVNLETKLQQVLNHSTQAHGEAMRSISVTGLIMKTLITKGLVTEEEFRKVAEESRKEHDDALKARAEAAKQPVAAPETPPAPASAAPT